MSPLPIFPRQFRDVQVENSSLVSIKDKVLIYPDCTKSCIAKIYGTIFTILPVSKSPGLVAIYRMSNLYFD